MARKKTNLRISETYYESKTSLVLWHLEQHFEHYSKKKYDREFSLMVIEDLLPLYKEHSYKEIRELFMEFCSKHESKLKKIFIEYSKFKLDGHKFVIRPEAIAIFERLEKDEYALRDHLHGIGYEDDVLECFWIAWEKSIY